MKIFKFLVASVSIFPLVVFAYQNPGEPSGFVNDFTNTLSHEQISALENKLQNFYDRLKN